MVWGALVALQGKTSAATGHWSGGRRQTVASYLLYELGVIFVGIRLHLNVHLNTSHVEETRADNMPVLVTEKRPVDSF